VSEQSTNASAGAAAADAALVAASIGGDRAAFGTLVGRYKGMVMGRTYAITGDWHEAEDLAQESFVRAFRALSQLERPAEFAAWLGTIAKNLALSSRTKLRPVTADALTARADSARTAPSEQGSPAEAASKRELYEMALREIESLPEEYRSTVYLRYLKNRSCRQIAEVEGVAVGVVTSRLSRAAAALREKLAPKLGTNSAEGTR